MFSEILRHPFRNDFVLVNVKVRGSSHSSLYHSASGTCSFAPPYDILSPEPVPSIVLFLPRRSRWLGDFTVVAGAVLRRALRRTDGLWPLQAVAFGAAGWVGQRVWASVHHDGVHAVGHGEGLEVGLDGDGQRQLVDEVDRRARHDGSAAEVLQAEHCGQRGDRDSTVINILSKLHPTTNKYRMPLMSR